MKQTTLTNENILLNTFFSGLYLSASDFIEAGSQIELKLSMQDRGALLKSLTDHAKNNHCEEKLKTVLFELLENRENELKELLSSYPNAKKPLESLTEKINGTKQTIENALSRYDDA